MPSWSKFKEKNPNGFYAELVATFKLIDTSKLEWKIYQITFDSSDGRSKSFRRILCSPFYSYALLSFDTANRSDLVPFWEIFLFF